MCVAVVLAVGVAACGRSDPKPAPPHPPRTSGTIRLAGLLAPVTVVRDTWGIPHISAESTADLFFAQGFVQAQDRLFQMDLWKRAAQGRLAEVLGANFVQRDAMTRRIQFRGDLAREWESYGPDARRIAVAFTDGINAWVRLARQELPEEFVAAGWLPELWRPQDLLNRTDAFLASSGAFDELLRARLVSAIGLARTQQVLPLPDGRRMAPDSGVDLSAINFLVSDLLRPVGTPPFFVTLGGPVSDAPRPGQADRRPAAQSAEAANAETAVPLLREASLMTRPKSSATVTGAGVTETGSSLVTVGLATPMQVPSANYLVHLTAPGWNVIGTTAPWLPGVAIGHNDQVAWAMVPLAADSQDIVVERVNPLDAHQVWRSGGWVDMAVDYERVDVKGRARPAENERQYTSNGIVIAQDTDRHLVYTLRWAGSEPGGAGVLDVLRLNRAASAGEFRDALGNWHAPTAEFVFADTTGTVGRRDAGVVPFRSLGNGSLPTLGLEKPTGGVTPLAAVQVDPSGSSRFAVGPMRVASGSAGGSGSRGGGSLRFQPRVSPSQVTLIRMLDDLGSLPEDLDRVRTRLVAIDAVDVDRSTLELISFWEVDLRYAIARDTGVPEQLVNELADVLDVVSYLRQLTPSRRDRLLVAALSEVGQTVGRPPAAASSGRGSPFTVSFSHPLAVPDRAKQRFNVETRYSVNQQSWMVALDGTSAVTLSATFDTGDWDRSVAVNAPGQSGAPPSAHYDDLAPRWGAGESIPLLFTQEKIAAEAADTIVLQPR